MNTTMNRAQFLKSAAVTAVVRSEEYRKTETAAAEGGIHPLRRCGLGEEEEEGLRRYPSRIHP